MCGGRADGVHLSVGLFRCLLQGVGERPRPTIDGLDGVVAAAPELPRRVERPVRIQPSLPVDAVAQGPLQNLALAGVVQRVF